MNTTTHTATPIGPVALPDPSRPNPSRPSCESRSTAAPPARRDAPQARSGWSSFAAATVAGARFRHPQRAAEAAAYAGWFRRAAFWRVVE
jgi:hypothetical protein